MPRVTTLRTERLALSALRPADAPGLARLTDDRDVARFLRLARTPYRPRDAAALIRRVSGPGLPVFGIDDGRLIGVIGLRGEFGFWLARQALGRGYATEAGMAVLAVAFRGVGLRRLEARVFRDNLASLRTLDRLGFRDAGRTAAFSHGRNATAAAVRLRLERQAWEASRTHRGRPARH